VVSKDVRRHRLISSDYIKTLYWHGRGREFSYELFDGNRADVSTVEAILRTVEGKHGKARRVWIFDRGVVSEENLVAIRKRGGQYLVGTPRSKLKQFEQELLKDDFEKIRPEVQVKQIRIPGGEETYILCQERTDRLSLPRTCFAHEKSAIFNDPYLYPPPYQPEHASVADSLLDHFHELRSHDRIKIRSDINF
jgi:hypothetical protein